MGSYTKGSSPVMYVVSWGDVLAPVPVADMKRGNKGNTTLCRWPQSGTGIPITSPLPKDSMHLAAIFLHGADHERTLGLQILGLLDV